MQKKLTLTSLLLVLVAVLLLTPSAFADGDKTFGPTSTTIDVPAHQLGQDGHFHTSPQVSAAPGETNTSTFTLGGTSVEVTISNLADATNTSTCRIGAKWTLGWGYLIETLIQGYSISGSGAVILGGGPSVSTHTSIPWDVRAWTPIAHGGSGQYDAWAEGGAIFFNTTNNDEVGGYDDMSIEGDGSCYGSVDSWR